MTRLVKAPAHFGQRLHGRLRPEHVGFPARRHPSWSFRWTAT